jgi:hypothetical protein
VVAAVAAVLAGSTDSTAARPPPAIGAQSSSGDQLLALWSRNGSADTRFPQPTGGSFPSVSAIEPDGRGGWFLGGSFDSVGGIECSSLAHIVASGAVDRGWCPRPDDRVTLISRAGGTLYVTGRFRKVDGSARHGVAAISVRTGHVTSWQPKEGFDGDGLATDTSTVFVVGGGHMAAFDRKSGRLRWKAVVNDRGCKSPGRGGCEAVIGAILARGNSVYVAGSFRHVEGVKRIGLAALDARCGRVLGWKADLNEDAVVPDYDVPWQLAAAGSTVYVGHSGLNSFDRIGGVPADGFAALGARTGAVRHWSPRLPRYEQGIDAFAASAPAFVAAYDYAESQYSDVFRTAVRLVDRMTGQKIRWTHALPGEPFGIPLVRIAGGRVLINYYSR